VKSINYRPFDKRFFYYSGKSKGVVGWPVPIVSKHLKYIENYGLMLNKKIEVGEFNHCLIYRGIVESHALSMKEINYVFPLYLYPETNAQQTLHGNIDRTPNLNPEIVKQLAEGLGLNFTNEPFDCAQGATPATFAPIDVLDYIYAVLHSPTYREKYAAFLKIDFPRVPYPKNKEIFWQLVKLGGEIRQIHLLESALVEKYITQYPIDGDNIVVKPRFENGKVYLNENQYFANVPEVAWNFYIGGYQPAQKWLKDRKGKELNTEDIFHYQKIIVALSETDSIMKKIDKIDF
jgi:predicted helicase